MAEKKKKTPEEKVQMASAEGEFHLNTIGTRMLQNGNKLRVVLETEYTPELMGDLAPLMDKDVIIKFKEILPKKTRDKLGDEDSKELPFTIPDGLN
jgi:hypothetical protein